MAGKLQTKTSLERVEFYRRYTPGAVSLKSPIHARRGLMRNPSRDCSPMQIRRLWTRQGLDFARAGPRPRAPEAPAADWNAHLIVYICMTVTKRLIKYFLPAISARLLKWRQRSLSATPRVRESEWVSDAFSCGCTNSHHLRECDLLNDFLRLGEKTLRVNQTPLFGPSPFFKVIYPRAHHSRERLSHARLIRVNFSQSAGEANHTTRLIIHAPRARVIN